MGPVGILLALLLFSADPLPGQEVKGRVIQAGTEQGIPYVNITVVDTRKGTVSDSSGRFRIQMPYGKDSLHFSCIGYRERTVAIKGDHQDLVIELSPKEHRFKEVKIVPEERKNPAHPIIQKVQEHKDSNSHEAIDHFNRESYNKVHVGLRPKAEWLNSWWSKPFRFVFENIDSSRGKAYLPLFISETLSREFFRRGPPSSRKEYILAQENSGFKNPTVTKYLGNHYQRIELHENTIELFGKQFISPISDHSFSFYHYYLADSLALNAETYYRIRFKPQRKGDLCFQGNILIHKGSYGVREVRMRMAPDVNINYLGKFRVRQNFERSKKGQWLLVRDHWYLEASVFLADEKEHQSFYAKKITSFEDIRIGKAGADSIFTGTDDISNERRIEEPSDSFWVEHRHEKLSDNERAVFSITDSIKKMPHYKVARTLARGYVDAGPVEFGPILGAYSFDQVEGHRFQFGMRTKAPFSERLIMDGYIAYGTKDEAWKYGGNARFFLSKSPRSSIGISGQKDLQQLGRSELLFENDHLISSALRRNPANKLNGVREYSIFYNKEWPIGLRHSIELGKRTLTPRGALAFRKKTEEGVVNVPSITSTELDISLHFAYREKYYTTSYDRYSMGSDYPILDLHYSKGLKGFLEGEYDHHRIALSLQHRINTGYLGELNYRLKTGKIWGSLPYPLLELHDGNETFFLNDEAFNTMNYYEFVSDEYASISITHHFEGLLFDRIPIIREMKLREVVSGKALIGNLHQRNREKMKLLDGTRSLGKPFVELSVGIENIFSFIRIDGVWRLTYRDRPNISTFGLRGTVQFGF
ncbi:MAG: DUF5686 family protein [Flavobacteriales bacterium]